MCVCVCECIQQWHFYASSGPQNGPVAALGFTCPFVCAFLHTHVHVGLLAFFSRLDIVFSACIVFKKNPQYSEAKRYHIGKKLCCMIDIYMHYKRLFAVSSYLSFYTVADLLIISIFGWDLVTLRRTIDFNFVVHLRYFV